MLSQIEKLAFGRKRSLFDVLSVLNYDTESQYMAHNVTGKNVYPVAQLLDIQIHFVHHAEFETVQSEWNQRKDKVLWDKLIIVFDDLHYTISDTVAEAFLCVPVQNKFMFLRRSCINSQLRGNIYRMPIYSKFPFNRNIIIEDWFDPVSWINGMFD